MKICTSTFLCDLKIVPRFALTCLVHAMIRPPPPPPPPPSPFPPLPLPPTPSWTYSCRWHSLEAPGDPTSGDWRPCILYPCSMLSAALLLFCSLLLFTSICVPGTRSASELVLLCAVVYVWTVLECWINRLRYDTIPHRSTKKLW